MKKIFFLAILFFYTFDLQASNSRLTSFDDRKICEENRGVWREFGDACVNNCQEQFDEFRVCAKAITYSCDCGIGRCWHQQKCISNSSYKIIADKEKEENSRQLAQKRKEREEKIQNNPALRAYLLNLYPIRNQQQQGQNQDGQQQQNQQPTVAAQNQGQIIQSSQNMAAPLTTPQTAPVIQNANITDAPQQRTPPPFYMQQQQQNQPSANLTNSEAAKIQAQPAPAQEKPLEFPQIPMPQ